MRPQRFSGGGVAGTAKLPRAALLPLLLIVPALAGCLLEDIHVALRVPSGQVRHITGAEYVDGTIVIERDATLILERAQLTVGQSILVEGGRLVARDSHVRLGGGSFLRNEIEVIAGTLDSTDSTIEGITGLRAASDAVLQVDGGRIEAGHLAVANARIASTNATWKLTPRDWADDQYAPTWGGSGLFIGHGGHLTIEGGGFEMAPTEAGIILDDGGALQLGNLTLDLTPSYATLIVSGGSVHLWNVPILARPAQDVMHISDGGDVVLVDSPLPREARHPFIADDGHLVIAWSLIVQAVSPPGNIPVGGLNVTLQSAHIAPGETADQNVTDENGEARLVAVQYIYGGGSGSRTGNPHVVSADDGGKRGATPALVVERPMRVTMPVMG